MGPLKNPRHERFYVYAVRIDRRTRYVGKGCGDRYRIHLTRSHNATLRVEVEAARLLGRPVWVRIIRDGLSEREAFRLERRAIAKWAPKIVNVSMGTHTDMERLAMQCRANLQTLKSEERVRREGAWMGVSVEERLNVLREVREALTRFAVAA